MAATPTLIYRIVEKRLLIMSSSGSLVQGIGQHTENWWKSKSAKTSWTCYILLKTPDFYEHFTMLKLP